MLAPAALFPADYFGPAVAAVFFVLGMSRVPEPARRNFNAILVAGTCGAYLNGGFGMWELLYPFLATPVVYRGLRSYHFIGLAWFMHAAWDLAHHFSGNPIWPFMPTSSFGCLIFDALIAVWFLAGAPALIGSRPKVTSRDLFARIDFGRFSR
jgi:Family of unknown function (DUF6010)